MDNKETLQNVRTIVNDYMSKLSELDEQTMNNMRNRFMNSVETIFELSDIKYYDGNELDYEIKERFEELRKAYIKPMEREETAYSFGKVVENREDEITAGDPKTILDAAKKDAENVIQNENEQAPNRMEQCLQECIEDARTLVKAHLVRNGYFNLDDLEDEIRAATMLLATEYGQQYRDGISQLHESTLENLYDEAQVAREDVNEMAEKLDINPRDVYAKYERGEISEGITLAKGELDIDVLMISEPLYAFTDEPIQKGICISKSIMDKALAEGNQNLFDIDASSSQYAFIEQESFVMVLTAEENERVGEFNKKKQMEKEAREAKEAQKSYDDNFGDYECYL